MALALPDGAAYSCAMKRFIGIPALVLACATTAQAESYHCTGEAPDWQLTFDDARARLIFPAATDMDVMLITTPQGRDWPQAYTLIGERDTAIVLLEHESCAPNAAYRAHVMTQRGQTPILLTGCCEVQE